MSDPRKHHFLPQFYLEFFRIEPKVTKYSHIFVIEKSKSTRSFSAAIHDTGALRDYNTIDTREGADHNFIETVLSRVESVHAHLVSRLVASRTVEISDRKELAFMMALMYCRVPKFKEIIKNSMRTMMETMGDIMLRKGQLPSPPPELARAFEEYGMTRFKDMVSVEISNWALLEQMYKCASFSPLIDLLSKMTVEILCAPDDAHFFTGDTPVTVYGGALAHEEVEVSFPLSPQVAILLSWKRRGRGCRTISYQDVQEYNRRTVVMSDRFLYSTTECQPMKKIVADSASESAGWRTDAFEYGDGAFLHLNFLPVG